MIKRQSLHTRIFAFLLLLCMLKVAFPVGEFFHNHHTKEELCTIATGDECHHQAHFSATDTHFDCIFLQLHQFFAPSFFTYHLWEQTISTVFSFIEKASLKLPLAFLHGLPLLIYQCVNLPISKLTNQQIC